MYSLLEETKRLVDINKNLATFSSQTSLFAHSANMIAYPSDEDDSYVLRIEWLDKSGSIQNIVEHVFDTLDDLETNSRWWFALCVITDGLETAKKLTILDFLEKEVPCPVEPLLSRTVQE